MIENNPIPPRKHEDWERITLISAYHRGIKTAIFNSETESFLLAILCALSSYSWVCYLLDRRSVWGLVLMAFSGNVCYKTAKKIIIQQVRKQWSYPEKTSSAEWERDAAKTFDDALASCTLTFYNRPIHIIIKILIIAPVLASVLFGALIYLEPGNDGRFLLAFAVVCLLSYWHYSNSDK